MRRMQSFTFTILLLWHSANRYLKEQRADQTACSRWRRIAEKLADETEGDFSFEYSPESFHGTEVDYAVEVCNAVLDVWQPSAQNKAIINIPATVETAMPHVFATQIEYVSKI